MISWIKNTIFFLQEPLVLEDERETERELEEEDQLATG